MKLRKIKDSVGEKHSFQFHLYGEIIERYSAGSDIPNYYLQLENGDCVELHPDTEIYERGPERLFELPHVFTKEMMAAEYN